MSAMASTAITRKVPITITPAAALRSWELIQAAQNPHLKLRVTITGRGCQGFGYDIFFTDTTEPDDTVITQAVRTQEGDESHTVDWVVGMISLSILNGVEIDYESSLQDERFIIRNLKVKSTCSCGHSFTLSDTDEEDTTS